MGRVYYDYNEYGLPHPDSEAATASSDLDLAVPFSYGEGDVVETAVGYIKLMFAIFSQGYLLVLLHWFRHQQIGERDSFWEKNFKGKKSPILRRRVELGRGRVKFLPQIFVRGGGPNRASGGWNGYVRIN